MRLRCLCFTVNNFRQQNLLQILQHEAWQYCVIGLETGEEETPHLQGYGELKRQRTRDWVSRFILPRAFIEPRRGRQDQAIAYCKKDGIWIEIGEPRVQGKRSDLEEIQAKIDEGVPETEIATDHFGSWARYRKSFQAYRELKRGRRPIADRDVRWYWGPPGSGKTKAAWDEFPNLYTHLGGRWFDGYKGEECVLIDDIQIDEFDRNLLLRLLDRYPMRVEVKGDSVEWTPDVVIVTANHLPEHQFTCKDPAPLLRRISTIRQFPV